jgi:hypothetical protein
MGMARLRAHHLGAVAVQIAIWDGVASAGRAGTGADVAAWRQQGGRSLIVDPGAVVRGLERPPPRVRADYERTLAAILALESGSAFTCRYMGRLALAKKYGDYPMYRLTRRR